MQNAYNCQVDSEMPVGIIDTILSGQCFVFLLFGVVVIFYLCRLAQRVYKKDYAKIRELHFSRDF